MNEPSQTQVLPVLGFEPTYHRVEQTNQWNSAIACIASVVKLPIEAVLEVAVQQFNRPASGRRLVTQKLIHDLFAHYDWWIATRYRAANVVNELPDLALILLSKKPDQFALFHRQKSDGGRLPVSYLINPALGLPDQQYRLDVDTILPCKYLGVCLLSDYLLNFW